MLRKLYEKRPKLLALVYVIIFGFSLATIGNHYITTGDYLPLDIELVGGKEISIFLTENLDIEVVRQVIPEDTEAKIVSGINPSLIIEAPETANENAIIESLRQIGIEGEISVRSFGPVLGELFWRQAQIAIIVAFLSMAILIFIIFRSPVPSAAIVMAGLCNMLFVLAMLIVLKIDVSLAIIAGILMIIGYSVDTDIVLTTTVTKETSHTVIDRAMDAMKTGLTITITALIAVVAMYLASGAGVIQDIASVLIIGLLIDIPMTWLANAGLLIWWMKKKEGV